MKPPLKKPAQNKETPLLLGQADGGIVSGSPSSTHSGATEDSEDPNGTLGVGTEHGNPKKTCPAMERAADQVSVKLEDIPK